MSEPGQEGSLQVSNRKVINSLSTNTVDGSGDNLWAICGATVDCPGTYRIVKKAPVFMHAKRPAGSVFY
jgi:hypothetical protein